MRISDWSSDVCSADLECEHERMVWMTGKIIGHSGSPWLVAGNRSVPSPRSKTRTLSPRSLPSHRGEQGPMGRAGGTADSLLKQTFRPSPRSGGWPVLLAIGEKLVRQIGRAHVGTPVTNAQHVCRLLIEKKTKLPLKHNI